MSGWALLSRAFLLAPLGLHLVTGAAHGQTCGTCGDTLLTVYLCSIPESIQTGTACPALDWLNCQKPEIVGTRIDSVPAANGTFDAHLVVDVKAPYNSHPDTSEGAKLHLFWAQGSQATDPTASLCQHNTSDRAETYVRRTGLTCAGAPYDFGTYSLRAVACWGTSCREVADAAGLPFQVTGADLGCPSPRKHECGCTSCKQVGPGGGSLGGGGGNASPGDSGPGAMLRYAAGGAGGTGLPGTAAWQPALGRFWSHDYAERIVVDPDDSHVWLITRWATFREFSNLAGGVYGTVSPTDEERTLHRTATGWELHELDSTVHTFDAAGLWIRTDDRNGNAKTATYAGGQLTSVTFPDGRSESFTYHGGGKLASISEVGVGGAASRTWTYTWAGDDLTRIDRPDGTAWEMTYGDARHPGWLTRLELVGTDASRRVETAWEYDDRGNTTKIWKGDTLSTGPNAAEVWAMAYDNATTPAAVTVTDPVGDASTYNLGRDSNSRKPKLLSVLGDCPGCGVPENATFEYADPANPLHPTAMTDGRGTRTQYTYDAATGMTTSRLEAVGTAVERETTWAYDATYSAFPTAMTVPSTAGGLSLRETLTTYDAAGNPTVRTIQGVEAGSAFSYATTTTFNAAGQPLSVDPPGHGAADVTSFTYDPARGNLLADTRTDPLVGTTTFGYDAYNRSTSVTDPNGVTTETAYDALNRVVTVTQKGAAPAEDLVTSHQYDAFGDLLRTTLPRGNVIEYGYDAARRLISIERKPDAVTPGERTFYTLDAAGNRTKEELQRWDGAAWVTESSTEYVYFSRCHLDKVLHPDGTATEYAYDCNGNLESVWDANHPRATNPTATQAYAYDALNRVTTVTQPWAGAGGGTAVTTYGYDVQDHMTSVTDAEGNVTTYVYGDRDLMTEQTSPVSGVTTWAYDEHGEMTSEIDARGIVMTRTVDALDRVTLVDYPGTELDTTYTYDDPLVPFSRGRLTRIARNGGNVDYAYDRFGRLLQDGDLTFQYDANGNRARIGYPSGIEAVYTHDFADREATLQVEDGASPPQTVVSSATYKPSGPLATLALGNGLAETRSFTTRYFPAGIQVPALLDWSYATDAVGNPTAIADNLSPAGSRTYTYQDYAYFLTSGNGPWGSQSWTYDKIGNRLKEIDEGFESIYTYPTNPAAGNNPKLQSTTAPRGLTYSYGYDAAGNQTTVAETGPEGSGRTITYGYDAASRLFKLSGPGTASTAVAYDGRGFLRESAKAYTNGSSDTASAAATYGSEGLLYSRFQSEQSIKGNVLDGTALRATVAIEKRTDVLYFAGRPVALRIAHVGGTSNLLYLTTDHLGTPVLTTDEAGAKVWAGGFEPFGSDFNFVQNTEMFLRFPGQWWDGSFGGYAFRDETYYNVHRWYGVGTGRYGRPDPILREATAFASKGFGMPGAYIYAEASPTVIFDPLGLLSCDGNWERIDSWNLGGSPINQSSLGSSGQRESTSCEQDSWRHRAEPGQRPEAPPVHDYSTRALLVQLALPTL